MPLRFCVCVLHARPSVPQVQLERLTKDFQTVTDDWKKVPGAEGRGRGQGYRLGTWSVAKEGGEGGRGRLSGWRIQRARQKVPALGVGSRRWLLPAWLGA